jgi:hypothetical protein
MFGLIIIFSGSVTVFLCTQFERSLDGNIKFNIPHTLFEEKYDDEESIQGFSRKTSHHKLTISKTKVNVPKIENARRHHVITGSGGP